MTNFKIIQKRNVWLAISGLIFVVCLAALMIWKLKFGIDFTGGSLLEVRFLQNRPTVTEVEAGLDKFNLGSLTVQPVGDDSMILRFQELTINERQDILKKLNELSAAGLSDKNKSNVEEIRYDSVGPSIGEELKKKSVYAIFWVFVVIVLYISIAFRKVSKPVSSWKYGISALLAMLHDVLITIGIFAILGRFYNIEINTPFVAAILTVLGYSIHDTIVVFDRIRENLPKSDQDFEGTVNMSLNQTLGRSINTSLTVLITLVAIIWFGGESIKTFALALAIGITTGTYSSIFVASPLLVLWDQFSRRGSKK